MSIKSIVLEIDGKDVTIPLEEAEKLYTDLGVLFDKPTKISNPTIYPTQPYYPLDTRY